MFTNYFAGGGGTIFLPIQKLWLTIILVYY